MTTTMIRNDRESGSRMPRPTLVRALVVVLLSSPAAAHAQTPLGPPIRVDTRGAATGFMHQTERDVSLTPDGDFNVTWLARDAVVWPWSYDIAARRFGPGGLPKAPDFIVNAYTPGLHQNESIASDAAGNFVIVWHGPMSDGATGVAGQRFDAAGARLGAEFQVDSATAYAFPYRPLVAMSPGGEFAVVWYRGEILARRYDASGTPMSVAFQVNTTPIRAFSKPSIDFDAAGNFVVAWSSAAYGYGLDVVRAQLFAAAGTRVGFEIDVSDPAGFASFPRVARGGDGSFVVAWRSTAYGSPFVIARRFDPSGAAVGAEFNVGGMDGNPPVLDVDVDADGDFVVVWNHAGTIQGRRYDSAGTPGSPFLVSVATSPQQRPSVSSDPAGNFVVVWRSVLGYQNAEEFARRYAGGLSPSELSVDASAGPASDGDGVFEAGETVSVVPTWLNANFGAETFSGTAASFNGPGTPGNPTYAIADAAAAYGTVAANDVGNCGADCYALGITAPAIRPATHWDASFREVIAPANLGAQKNWVLHIGDSFGDVPRANPFYRFVETLLHRGVTTGCGASAYCPSQSATRDQMAVFVLVAKDGPGAAPPACGTPVFADVPATSPFCPWVEELARRGVVSGCGGGSYCPTAPVSREQMAVFVLRTADPAFAPHACRPPNLFGDVPETSPFCAWIEELARRGVVSGCGGGNYCPASSVTRGQMAVFISSGFGLQLYGP
jgi:S-layer family protein